MDEYTRPDPDAAALLTIDTQNDFTLPSGRGTIPGTAAVVPQIARLAEAFRKDRSPVIHAVRLYRVDGSNVDACRRAEIEDGAGLVQPGTWGAELVDALTPESAQSGKHERLLDDGFQTVGPAERIMYKPRWGAFFETPLHDFLTERSISTLVVCGCNFPNCPRTTIYEASERDYRLVFVPDATSGTYERGLDELRAIGVAVKDTDQAVQWLA